MNMDIVITEVIHVVKIPAGELEIVAYRQHSEAGDIEWSLQVVNAYGLGSAWTKTFPSPEAAIKEGMRALQTEGIEAFTSTENFEYLPSIKNSAALPQKPVIPRRTN